MDRISGGGQFLRVASVRGLRLVPEYESIPEFPSNR